MACSFALFLRVVKCCVLIGCKFTRLDFPFRIFPLSWPPTGGDLGRPKNLPHPRFISGREEDGKGPEISPGSEARIVKIRNQEINDYSKSTYILDLYMPLHKGVNHIMDVAFP
jgi:hypothetical protein